MIVTTLDPALARKGAHVGCRANDAHSISGQRQPRSPLLLGDTVVACPANLLKHFLYPSAKQSYTCLLQGFDAERDNCQQAIETHSPRHKFTRFYLASMATQSEEFQKATADAGKLTAKPSNDELLDLYGTDIKMPRATHAAARRP